MKYLLQSFESRRKKKLTKLILIEILCFVIVYYFLPLYKEFLYFEMNTEIFDTNIFMHVIFYILMIGMPTITLMAAGCIFMLPPVFNKDFKTEVKKECKIPILRNCKGLKWSKFSLSAKKLRESGLFSTFTDVKFDDMLSGTVNGVEYKIAETELRQVGSKHDIQTFKGIIISFNSNKKIESYTTISTKGDFNVRNMPTGALFLWAYWVYTLGCLISFPKDEPAAVIISITFFLVANLCLFLAYRNNWGKKKKLENVKLESTNFDKRYVVHSKDQIDARYLLTPAFVDRFENLKTSFGTNKIKCAFFDDQIMFAISTKKDLFEICSLYSPMSNTEYLEDFYKEIQSVTDMVEYFKFDEKTGL